MVLAASKLFRLDGQGNVKAGYESVSDLGDLIVGESGRLWGLSESGSAITSIAETRFPCIFQIDVGKLR